MSLSYEEALKIWGARRLVDRENRLHESRDPRYWPQRERPLTVDDIDMDSVRVSTVFDEGDSCCGGSDPSCYCSQATSPIAEVSIRGRTRDWEQLSDWIGLDDFDHLGDVPTPSGVGLEPSGPARGRVRP